jgi:trigger factor
MGRVQAQVEELQDSRVRLKVAVSAHDVKHAVEHAASDLSESVKVPGFRKGKVPLPVLISRVGRERLFAEAVESHIGGWFWNAASRTRIRPVDQPQYGYDLPTSDDEPWEFTATVEVQAKPDLPDLTQLEVPAPEAEIPAEVVDQALEELQETAADLSPADRSAQPGDVLVLDLVVGDDARRNYVVELGTGRLASEIEQRLLGGSAGETTEVAVQTAELPQTVTVTLKEIHEKVLPPLDDELAARVSEFDTLAELRADIEQDLREQFEAEIESRVRADAVDVLVDAAGVEARGPVVEARTRELLDGLARSVERRGLSFDAYVAATGRSPEELVTALRAEAARSVARELVLEAIADDENISVSDDEVDALVREQASETGEDPEQALQELREHGTYERLREDLRLRAALDRLVAQVKRIPVEVARARESIWTPEQEKPAGAAKLWTPGSKENV